MGVGRSVARQAGKRLAPSVASGFVRGVLEQAIDGLGPLRSAAASADAKLVDAHGDVELAVSRLIRRHVTWAGAQGFVTNLGGLIIAPIAIPANVVGVTLVQCHLIAGIAHLRGYDLANPRVRNAILVCMLGEESAKKLFRTGALPKSVLDVGSAIDHDPALDAKVSKEVTTDLIARTAGRRIVTLIGRRIPLIGGVIGGGADALMTHQLGRFAGTQLADRNLG